jgi:GDP-L-fucose synthase
LTVENTVGAVSAMQKDAKIFVAGHRGLVGSAIWRELERKGFISLTGRTRAELDLTSQQDVIEFFNRERPDYVFLAAARVGGIQANDRFPADFLLENLEIQSHVIKAAQLAQVRKLLFLGSSCIYPRLAAQPLREDALLTGPLEPTNQWYAIAKIAGLKMCQAFRRQYGCDFISAMPTNLYGPNDNYDLATSHVLPALIRRFHEAKMEGLPEAVLWGTGTPLREFLHVDDLARACVFLMEHYSEEEPINVGSGIETSVRDLATLVSRVVGYSGRIAWDTSKPDGTPRKLMDNSRILGLGWRPGIDLETGVRLAYEDFVRTLKSGADHRLTGVGTRPAA